MAEAKIFELNNGTMHVRVSNFGCTITSLLVPDKEGNLADVVLGFDSLEPYQKGDAPYFGCIVGRVANRIKDGKFTLNGVEYTLPINRPPNCLHAGMKNTGKAVDGLTADEAEPPSGADVLDADISVEKQQESSTEELPTALEMMICNSN